MEKIYRLLGILFRPLRVTWPCIFVIGYLSFVIPAAGAAGPPDPQPCKNPVSNPTELVNNYIIEEDGKPPIKLRTAQITGAEGQQFDVAPQSFTFTIDFSQLQSIFGDGNSDYLEGKYQKPEHQNAPLLSLSSQDLNQFNGPGVKNSPKILADELRINYVKYVYEKPTLAESANKISDAQNKDPKTIYDLVSEYGQPKPPDAKSTEEEKTLWMETWGKYWEKIPTSFSEFYEGEIMFHAVAGDKELEKIKFTDSVCPKPIMAPIKFVMPDFYRTTATSDQLNRLLVPQEAQSYKAHGIIEETEPAANSPLKQFFSFCWKLLQSPTNAAKNIKNVISQIVGPQPVYAAQENPSCVKMLNQGKKGQAPYCPLPQAEVNRLGSALTCSNKTENLKLEKDNPNVVCTFNLSTQQMTYAIKSSDPNCNNNNDGTFTCTPVIYVIPNFRIPWLAAIWNNTLDSQLDQGTANADPNRPGIYSFFTPKSIYSILFPTTKDRAKEILKKCYPNWPDMTMADCTELDAIGNVVPCAIDVSLDDLAECVSGKLDKSVPGEVLSSREVKERFIGGTDCSKVYVRDMALKPKVLQETAAPKSDCVAQSASISAATPSGPPPLNAAPNDNNCEGKYTFNNPVGNFGDPSCDFSIEKLTTGLQRLDPARTSTWLLIAARESGYNPNAYAPVSTSGTAWGLFQMGHEAYPELGIDKQMNNEFDRGDVVWALQAFNAVNYNNGIGNSYCYWEAAIILGFATGCTN